MATSGSNSFAQTRDQVIYDAFQILGVYGVGRSIVAEDITYASNTLNKMLKAWSTQGLHLWCKEECVLYLTQYTASYTIGNQSTNANSSLASASTVSSLTSSNLASSAALVVSTTAGMTIGDYIGVQLPTGALYWTTIATIPSSTSLTLTAASTSALNNGALVFTYTSKVYKPLRILDARLVGGMDSGATSTRTEIQMTPIAYMTYYDTPSKNTNGRPTEFLYNPNLTTGQFTVWPRPSDCSYRIEYTAERIIQDVNSASDSFDLPAEWLEPVTWQLAVRMGPAYGKLDRLQIIGPMASAMLEALKDWDTEITSVTLAPDMEYNG